MNEEMNELDELLNHLAITSLETHNDYTSEFTYKDQKMLYEYIKYLQQERDKYKSIVDELKEWLKERTMKSVFGGEVTLKVLNKLKELEEGNSND